MKWLFFFTALVIAHPAAQSAEYQLEVRGASTLVYSPADGPVIGDVYYLNGALDDDWTKSEWDQYYSVAKWLVKRHYRVLMNPIAYESDVREAVQNPKSVAIVWSSHGNEQGLTSDAGNHHLPTDVFSDHASTKLQLIVLSNCYGEKTVAAYTFPSWTKVKHWTGTTNTPDMVAYLFSDDFNHDLGW